MTESPVPTLGQRVAAEAVGTGLLVMAVVGSGIAAASLSPDDVGLQLLENSLITGAMLIALIVTLQPISASFNPVVTLLDRVQGTVDTATASILITAQILGGVGGVVLANLMFDLDAVTFATTERATPGHLLGEVIATAGLVLVIVTCLRRGRAAQIGYVVAGYITAAYWFTSSTSFANPAVTVSRMFSDTFAGIAPSSAPAFIAMQLLGGAIGFAIASYLSPTVTNVPTQPEGTSR